MYNVHNNIQDSGGKINVVKLLTEFLACLCIFILQLQQTMYPIILCPTDAAPTMTVNGSYATGALNTVKQYSQEPQLDNFIWHVGLEVLYHDADQSHVLNIVTQ